MIVPVLPDGTEQVFPALLPNVMIRKNNSQTTRRLEGCSTLLMIAKSMIKNLDG